MLLGDQCGAHTFPYLEVKNTSSQVEHEASTSKIGEDQIFYCRQRGISTEDAVSMIVHGFCKEVFRELPDGVRGGSAEAAGREFGRKRRLALDAETQRKTWRTTEIMALLEIKICTPRLAIGKF